jgi:hypothetical protein
VGAAAIVLLAFSLPGFSQTQQGSIRGTVLDQTGGAVGEASVTVTDVARGIARTLVTDNSGEYVATNLNPGTYSLRVGAGGFRTVERGGVLVEVGQNLRVDFVVLPGEQTQTVTVTEEIPLISTTDSTLGGSLSNASINELPLNGRNFARLLQLRPGTVTPIGAGSGASQTNGRRNSSDSLRVEGIAEINSSQGATILNQSYSGGDSASSVPIDAIQEFSVQTNGKAEYGFRDGGNINVAIKSGTNALHGTAYAFGRNANATDAANYFTGVVAPATMQSFGGSAGGPIFKDKLFWFANYEGLRVEVGNNTPTTVPVSVAGTGPTSSMVDACNAVKASGKAINPLSAQLSGLNPITCVVTPASSTVENIFPHITSQQASNNWLPPSVNTTPLNNGLAKFDYAISSHHHLNGMLFISKSEGVSASSNGVAIAPQWGTFSVNNVQQYSGHWTWTPNSTWVNDFTLGYVFLRVYRVTGDANMKASDPWPQGYGMNTGVTDPLFGGLSAIQITGFNQVGGGGTRVGRRGPQGDVDLIDSVSYLRGKHAFKFGFEYLYVLAFGDTYPNSYGTVKFTTLQNFLQGVTNGGSIELGNPDQRPKSNWYGLFIQDDWRLTPRVTLNMGLRWEYYSPVTERDNFLGNFYPDVDPATTPAILQFGPGTGRSEYKTTKNNFSPRLGFAWDVRGDGKTVVRAGAAILQDAMELGPLLPIAPFGTNFPSIGVNKSGTAENAATAQTLNLKAGDINWNTTGATIYPSSFTQVTNGVTYTGLSCNVAGVGNGPCQTGGVDTNFKHGYTTTWNLDVQRAITNKLTLDVSYVGNHGSREEVLVDLNQPTLGTGWNTPWTAAQLAAQTATTKVPNVAGNILLTSNQICLGQGSTAFGVTCLPNVAAETAAGAYTAKFPYLSSIDIATTGTFSTYNGLHTTLQGRNFHGLSFITGYTYSHALSIKDGNSVNTQNLLVTDKNNLRLNYGNSASDVRHRFTWSPTYLIPDVKSPLQMLQGWSVNAILILQAGMPWGASDTTSFDWLGTGENGNAGIGNGATQPWNYSGPPSAFANSTANPIPCYGAVKGCTAFASAAADIQTACRNAAQAPYGGSAAAQQLALAALGSANGACYIQNGGILTPPAFGTVGNAGNIFVGQSYKNVDFSVAKIWKFKERYSAQFRTEFFNFFNRPDFATPSGNPTQGFAKFGTATATPDSNNSVLGSGGPRHIQFGLKLTF